MFTAGTLVRIKDGAPGAGQTGRVIEVIDAAHLFVELPGEPGSVLYATGEVETAPTRLLTEEERDVFAEIGKANGMTGEEIREILGFAAKHGMIAQ